ncbi:MAG: hypothetical protein IJ428_01010 [Clostridia bacterium]|nr:hypothetical protein [Clostridia bacterium]
MQTATKEFLTKLDELCEKRKQEIRSAPDELEIKGTAYYVSRDGDDNGDGLTPETAWRTLDKVSSAELLPGDGVLFRRGDLFRGSVATKDGVSYGAWGTGDKPKLYGWDKDLADPALWYEADSEHHIWKLNDTILDVGTLVFNHGQAHSIKLIPSYIDGHFVCRNDESKLFEMSHEMTTDLDIYWHFDSILTTIPSKGKDFPIPDMLSPNSRGELYLRCDKGNPGEVFDSIEALTRRSMFGVGMNANVCIDNLCIKYVGLHAVAAGGECSRGLHVTNCEIGWIGGTIQHYFGTDPNFPRGGRGMVTRFGNGIEIYGGCDDYLVSNCYVYQVYDAGMSHQITTHGKKRTMTNVTYRDNLVERCVYSIEYFLEMNKGDTESYMDGIEMCGNILRESGYGWGQQRHNTDTPAHIKGWSYTNKARNYTIHDNIFDRAAYRMLHLVAEEQESCPAMYANTYVQHLGNMIGQYGANAEKEPDIEIFDERAEEKIASVFKDKEAKVYAIG